MNGIRKKKEGAFRNDEKSTFSDAALLNIHDVVLKTNPKTMGLKQGSVHVLTCSNFITSVVPFINVISGCHLSPKSICIYFIQPATV
jgi:hypothetical protein